MSYATRARTNVLGPFVARAAALPPATGVSDDLFSVTGEVLLTGFFGLVTVAIPNESLDFTLDFDPDDGGADVAMATILAVDNTAVGSWIVLNETTGDVLVVDLDMSDHVALSAPLALWDGDIKLTCAGGGAIGTAARIKWGLTYVPLSSDGAIVAV
jgi:hypothetical protein